MDDPKQHVIDSLKQATNILVTVKSSPSIDQLSACIALTLVINELGKHGTAVFSGQVPSVLEFLEPEKTIEKNTDSLQDFIISLDKAKADKLRYKVEDTVVKVFITPYRVSLSNKDLEFSQGDFNVDVVVALGVHNQDDLDEAITAHGRILHDATVISINTDSGASEDLGSINWVDTAASSLSEMIANVAGQLGKEDIIDNQIATALLTGVVTETERFGNAKTKPATMELAARLLAAGANQELVATKLSEPAKPQANLDGSNPNAPTAGGELSASLSEPLPADNGNNGELAIEHPLEAAANPSPFAQEGAAFEIPQSDDSGQTPPVYNPDQPADKTPASDPPALTPMLPAFDSGEQQQPHTDESAALDYLKGRKVEHNERRMIVPPSDSGSSSDGLLDGLPQIGPAVTGPSAEAEKADQSEVENNKYALSPPSMGGTLTANMPAGEANREGNSTIESIVNRPAPAMPILSHNKPATSSDSPAPQPATTPPPAMQAAPFDARPTLADLEKQVHSSHVETAVQTSDAVPAGPQPQLEAAPQDHSLAGALDMPPPATTVNLPPPQVVAPSNANSASSLAPPPPVPPPLPRS